MMLPDGWRLAPDSALWEQLADAEGLERGLLLAELGMRRYGEKSYDESLAMFEGSAAAFEKVGAEREAAESLYSVGRSLWLLDRNREAIDVLKRAAAQFDDLRAMTELADTHHLMGRAFIDDGAVDDALGAFETAMQLHASESDQEKAGRTAMALGETLGGLGRQTEALEIFDRARTWFRSIGAASLVAWADDRRAAALIDLGQMQQAIGVLRNCVLVLDTAGQPIDRAYAAYRLGWTLRINDERDEALEVLSRARSIYATETNVTGMARCDLEAAHALHGLNRFAEADDLYTRCRATFDALGDDQTVVLVDSARADNLVRSGHRDRAVDLQRDVLDRAFEIDAWLTAGVATRLADNLCDLDRPGEALEVLDRAEDASSAFGNEQWEHNTRRYTYARAHAGLGNTAQAKALCEQALAELADTDVLQLRAQLHELYGTLIEEEAPTQSNQNLAYAVALYLASGNVESAVNLSRRFKPPVSSRPPVQLALDIPSTPEEMGGQPRA